MQLRRAMARDVARITELILPVCKQTIFEDLEAEGIAMLERLYAPASLLHRMAKGDRLLVAECGDRLVGAFGVRDPAHVWMCFISERGEGLGRALWEHARADPEFFGEEDEITLHSSLGAVGFYERMGFRATGPQNWKHGIVSVPMSFNQPGGR